MQSEIHQYIIYIHIHISIIHNGKRAADGLIYINIKKETKQTK